MYLSLLEEEKKYIFLDLELYMSKIDGDFSEEEKEIILTHCMEMHIDLNDFECRFPLNEVLSKLQNEFDDKEKRIVYLELVATVLADGVYEEAEKKLIDKLSDLLHIDNELSNEAFSIIVDLKENYKRCREFIMED